MSFGGRGEDVGLVIATASIGTVSEPLVRMSCHCSCEPFDAPWQLALLSLLRSGLHSSFVLLISSYDISSVTGVLGKRRVGCLHTSHSVIVCPWLAKHGGRDIDLVQ